MDSNILKEISEITSVLSEKGVECYGLVYDHKGSSDHTVIKDMYGLEFIMSKHELEMSCTNKMRSCKLTTWVRKRGSENFYKMIKD